MINPPSKRNLKIVSVAVSSQSLFLRNLPDNAGREYAKELKEAWKYDDIIKEIDEEQKKQFEKYQQLEKMLLEKRKKRIRKQVMAQERKTKGKDGEEWKSTGSFQVNDLQKLERVIKEAQRFLMLKDEGQSKPEFC